MINFSIFKLIKSFFKQIYKILIIKIFFFIYGRVYFSKKLNSNYFSKKIVRLNKIDYSVFKISNGRIYTDQVYNVAYIKNNQLIEGPSIQLNQSRFVNVSENIVLKKGTTRLAKKITGDVLSILTGAGGNYNYWHWLFDVLPRIFLYEKFYSLKKLEKILVPNLKEKFQIQTLFSLGINKEQIINANYYRHIIAKELFATSHPTMSNIERIPFWVISFLRERFIKNNKVLKNKFDKIYIDRSDSKSNVKNFRKIINEKEIINFLISRGFNIVKLSEFSFPQQVSIFNNANYIVGLHGAGFANLVFCKKNTNILEIKPIKEGNVVKNLSIDNNLKYSSISLKPLDKPIARQFGTLYLPLKRLRMFFK
jgi:capsular polysaccharide biosynthesis protein